MAAWGGFSVPYPSVGYSFWQTVSSPGALLVPPQSGCVVVLGCPIYRSLYCYSHCKMAAVVFFLSVNVIFFVLYFVMKFYLFFLLIFLLFLLSFSSTLLLPTLVSLCTLYPYSCLYILSTFFPFPLNMDSYNTHIMRLEE